MQGYERAKQILTENKETLTRIAEALLERETLDSTDVQMLIEGKPLEEKPTPAPQKDEDEKAKRRRRLLHLGKMRSYRQSRPTKTHHPRRDGLEQFSARRLGGP